MFQVVKERPDDLLLDRFFLVTSLTLRQMSHNLVFKRYRERGKAEGHMGELKDVLAPALSSANRAKTYVRGRKPRSAAKSVDAFACNEVRLLRSLMAYQVVHIARRTMARATGTGMEPAPPPREGAARWRAAGCLRPTHDPDALLFRSTVLGRALATAHGSAMGRPVDRAKAM